MAQTPLSIQQQAILTAFHQGMQAEKALRYLKNKRAVVRVEIPGGDGTPEAWVVKALHLNLFQRVTGLFLPRLLQRTRLLEGLTPPIGGEFLADGWYFSYTRDAGGDNLCHLLAQFSQNEAKECSVTQEQLASLFEEAGKIMYMLHSLSLHHGDLKSANFIWNRNCPSLPSVLLVDCDRVRKLHCLFPHSYQKMVAFSLAQFLASLLGKPEDVIPMGNCFLASYRESAEAKGQLTTTFQRQQLMQEVCRLVRRHQKIERTWTDPAVVNYSWSMEV